MCGRTGHALRDGIVVDVLPGGGTWYNLGKKNRGAMLNDPHLHIPDDGDNKHSQGH